MRLVPVLIYEINLIYSKVSNKKFVYVTGNTRIPSKLVCPRKNSNT
jgi:hypothetical protein